VKCLNTWHSYRGNRQLLHVFTTNYRQHCHRSLQRHGWNTLLCDSNKEEIRIKNNIPNSPLKEHWFLKNEVANRLFIKQLGIRDAKSPFPPKRSARHQQPDSLGLDLQNAGDTQAYSENR